jgi:magnesium chelatase family protein
MFVGELSVEGRVRHTPGILPMAATARAAGLKTMFVPPEDAAEAALLDDIDVKGTPSLTDLVAHLRGDIELPKAAPTLLCDNESAADDVVDFAQIRGQAHAKRALEFAAGAHNVLMTVFPALAQRSWPERYPVSFGHYGGGNARGHPHLLRRRRTGPHFFE